MKSRRLVTLSLFMVASVAMAGSRSPQDFTDLIATEGLRGWYVDNGATPCVRNEAGTITVRPCAGWLRTDTTIYGDYSVSFEVRSRSTSTNAFLGVLGVDGHNRRSQLAVALPLVGAADAPKRSTMTIQAIALSASGRAQALKAEDEWNVYQVTRNRAGVHVVLNGVAIASSGAIRASDGWLGFHADAGELDVRGVRLRHVLPTHSSVLNAKAGELVEGAYTPGNGVALPILVHEAKPQYTSEAMTRLLEGTVLLLCVVAPDGGVSDVRMARSLDPDFGLDVKAIEAARKWRFKPAMRDGIAMPAWISIELTFTLKK